MCGALLAPGRRRSPARCRRRSGATSALPPSRCSPRRSPRRTALLALHFDRSFHPSSVCSQEPASAEPGAVSKNGKIFPPPAPPRRVLGPRGRGGSAAPLKLLDRSLQNSVRLFALDEKRDLSGGIGPGPSPSPLPRKSGRRAVRLQLRATSRAARDALEARGMMFRLFPEEIGRSLRGVIVPRRL